MDRIPTYPVLMVSLNNRPLTMAAIETVRRQDLPDYPDLLVIDNASTDDTIPNLIYAGVDFMSYPTRQTLSKLWNIGLEHFFNLGAAQVLVVNNDVLLPPEMYSRLLQDQAGFVTGVGVSPSPGDQTDAAPTAARPTRSPHPDFSCFMIRLWVWEKVGPFDENFQGAFCEDLDYHVRMHKAGVEAVSIDCPYTHHASATIKSADPEFRLEIQQNAERNRAYFLRKWGVPVPTPENEGREYYRLFGSDHGAPT